MSAVGLSGSYFSDWLLHPFTSLHGPPFRQQRPHSVLQAGDKGEGWTLWAEEHGLGVALGLLPSSVATCSVLCWLLIA